MYWHRDAIIIVMRTTVNLPEDVYQIVRSLALVKQISFGEALTQMVRAGLHPPSAIDTDSLFPHFSVSKGAPPITLEHTLQVEDEL
jgi:hypothetical protein